MVRAWVTDLARRLTLLLGGGLAAGVRFVRRGGNPTAAKAAARTLVDAAVRAE